MEKDYRDSHAAPGKGESYDRTFEKLPFRAALWKLEQRFLLKIAKRFYAGVDINHLDFACGTGRVTAFLADHVSTSTGVDISENMLEVARKQAPSTELIEADLTRDDVLGDRKFNLITAFRFFPNAQPGLRSEAMSALVKHLADDGRIVFNNHRNTASLLYRLIRLVKRKRRGGVGMSPEEVRDLVGAAGLEIEKIYHAGILPVTDMHRVLPRFIFSAIEWPASACPICTSLAQDLLFVCRRTKGGAKTQ